MDVMARRAHNHRQRASSDWWRDFFNPIVGQVMFTAKAGQAESEVRQVVRQTRIKPPLKVLDLACGTGRHSLLLAKRGFEVTGLDYSKSYLREAAATARKSRTRIRFVHGDMKELDRHFQPHEFELVVSLYNSFGYFSSRRDDLKMLKAVHRVLAAGGLLVLNTLNGDGVKERLKRSISLGSEPLPNVFMIDRAWGMLPGGPFDSRKSWHQTVVARKPKGDAAARRHRQVR
jgi:SAM-dependent methyltransferase